MAGFVLRRYVRLAGMRVFGIDCGTEFTGYGVVERDAEARTPMEGISR